MLPPMVSYAQNAEDVVLRRVFAGQETGFYVDVGACVPVDDSVTLHFYEQGWSGVNVEPDPRFHGELVEARPRDVNLQVAIGSGGGRLTFFPTAVRGQGTLDPDLAQDRGEAPPVEVEQTTLREVVEAHAPSTGVDFLKVDVEGWEAEVLASADWTAVRPRVVVVEAVDPKGQPTHDAWEPDLVAAGYVFGLFDGLNRFYCREEDEAALLPLLQAPANVLDNWRQAREVRQQELLLQQLEQAHAAAADRAAFLQAALEDEQHAHAQTQAALRDLQSSAAEGEAALAAAQAATAAAHDATRAAQEEMADARAELGRVQELLAQSREAEQRASAELAAAARELEREREAHAAVRHQLDGVYASTSWRLTVPVRNASRLAKVMRSGPRS